MCLFGLRLRQGHKKDLEERQVLQGQRQAGIKTTGLSPQQEDLQ